MKSDGLVFRETHQNLSSKIAPHAHGSNRKVPSISAGKALFFKEQELALNQWVGWDDPYS